MFSRGKPGEPGPVVRRKDDELELVELLWGLRPRRPGDSPVINLRSEGRLFTGNRCLAPASDFVLRAPDRSRWRFRLREGGHFYLAGVWSPAEEDWPAAYAVLTTAANPDVARIHHRQMAVIPAALAMEWVDGATPQDELLRPLPEGTYLAEPA